MSWSALWLLSSSSVTSCWWSDAADVTLSAALDTPVAASTATERELSLCCVSNTCWELLLVCSTAPDKYYNNITVKYLSENWDLSISPCCAKQDSHKQTAMLGSLCIKSIQYILLWTSMFHVVINILTHWIPTMPPVFWAFIWKVYADVKLHNLRRGRRGMYKNSRDDTNLEHRLDEAAVFHV